MQANSLKKGVLFVSGLGLKCRELLHICNHIHIVAVGLGGRQHALGACACQHAGRMRERRVTDCRPLYARGPVHKRLGAGLRTHRSTAFIHVSLNVFRTVVRANGIGRSQKTKVERIWKDEMQTGT